MKKKNPKAEIQQERTLEPLPLEDDRDSLSVLPLNIIPLQTKALRTARMIKNVRLESVIETFRNESSGSGQYNIQDLGPVLGWPQEGDVPDRGILMKLALLHSYDVFSLRISLREYGIPVNEIASLKLSDKKNEQLTGYMAKFTRPLISQIYGNTNVEIEDFDDILALFRNPDKKKALESLQVMAKKLDIDVMQVPIFLEDYGDIFLSLSYYRQCLDSMGPPIEAFLDSLDDIRKNFQLKNDRNLMKTCDMVEGTLNNLTAEITGRFENFDRSTNDMWKNLTAERFRRVEELIKNYHTTIGGVLCALWVKMDAFQRMFPKSTSGGPVKRSEFIMTEMRQGLDKMRKIEDSAPMLAGLD